jgi:hypothetical protein
MSNIKNGFENTNLNLLQNESTNIIGWLAEMGFLKHAILE